MAKVLMGFRLPGIEVGKIEKAISETGIDSSLSKLMQVHVVNIANGLKLCKTVKEKKDLIYSYLNYKF